MKNSKAVKIFLVISGLLLTFIGGSTLLNPIVMKASAGIDLSENINLLNDTRGFSALLLSFAILIILGAFAKRLRFTSILISTVLFLSIGVGRVVSIFIDGTPHDSLLKATGIEFIIGIIGFILFVKFKEK